MQIGTSNSGNLYASASNDIFFSFFIGGQLHIKENFVNVEKVLVMAKLKDAK